MAVAAAAESESLFFSGRARETVRLVTLVTSGHTTVSLVSRRHWFCSTLKVVLGETSSLELVVVMAELVRLQSLRCAS